MAAGIAAGETKTRKPVDASHPCVAAAVAVLRQVGGPLPISVIFEHAYEMGLLPASAHNTIRGRLSQHALGVQHPAVVPLSGRRGWTLTGAAEEAPPSIGEATRLRDVTLTPRTMRRAGAPADFVRLVELTPGGTMTVRSALMRPIDGPGLDWLLAGAGGLLRFPDVTADKLRRASGVGGRARVIHALERRDQGAVA